MIKKIILQITRKLSSIEIPITEEPVNWFASQGIYTGNCHDNL